MTKKFPQLNGCYAFSFFATFEIVSSEAIKIVAVISPPEMKNNFLSQQLTNEKG